jgi:hypothetical protein
MVSEEDRRPRKEPDYARGLDKEPGEKEAKPDFARGREHRPRPGDKYDTDYARGLDRGEKDQHYPNYARGLAHEQHR